LDVETLPEDTVWMRRVLARGEPDAEDNAQEAWLVALQQSPSKGALRLWLVGVVKSKLRNRSELLRLAAQLVMNLDAPVRRTLLLRLVEVDGKSFAEDPSQGTTRIIGPTGTSVRLRIRRAEGSEIEIDVVRHRPPSKAE
jgi:hypothetical protein